jgi:hypothetical protein
MKTQALATRTTVKFALPLGQEVIAVAYDGVFSHAHYGRDISGGREFEHGHLHENAYTTPMDVAQEVMLNAGKGYWAIKRMFELHSIGAWGFGYVVATGFDGEDITLTVNQDGSATVAAENNSESPFSCSSEQETIDFIRAIAA